VTPVTRTARPSRQLPVAETVLAAAGEAVLLATYASQDAVYHWLTHLLAGGTAALTALAALAAIRRRPVRSAPLWVLLGHVIAVIPDVFFAAGLAHEQWMDLFLAHISSHAVPGGLWTLYTTFLVALAAYLPSIANNRPCPLTGTRSPAFLPVDCKVVAGGTE
jgi:alkylation response protein AidB-like acyl-CoA dehydrogenase